MHPERPSSSPPPQKRTKHEAAAEVEEYEMLIEDDYLEAKDFPLDVVLKVEPPDSGVTVRHTNGQDEFVAVEALAPWKVGQLGCSARIFHADMEIVVHNLGCLLAIDDTFVAKVGLADLAALGRARSFRQAKMALLRQLCIVEVLLDYVTVVRDRARTELLQQISCLRKQPVAVDAGEIYGIVRRSSDLDFVGLCQQLGGNLSVSEELRGQARSLLQVELACERRNRWLNNVPVELGEDATCKLNSTLQLLCAKVLETHATTLLDRAPEFLRLRLKDVPQGTLFRVDPGAVQMFHDLDKALSGEIFRQPLQDLAERWTNRLKSIGDDAGVVISVNPIFFSLCRGLEEVMVELFGGYSLLESDSKGWHPVIIAEMLLKTDLARCLHREHLFIFRLLKHFDPAVVENVEPFDYQPRRLLKLLGEKPSKIADEFYAWFCLLDDALPADWDLTLYEQIVRNFVQLLTGASHAQLETIRVITLNTARFIVQTFPLVASARSGEDAQILQAQLEFINRTMLRSTECTTYYRDLIDVFSAYWKNRSQIVERISPKNEGMERIKKDLLKIVIVALSKNVGADLLVSLFRSLNDFLLELTDVPFDWLIKSVPGLAMSGMIEFKLVEPIANKWSGTANQTYRVTNPQKFQQMLFLMAEGSPCPRHYTIDAITTLLSYICAQLECARWTDSDQLTSTAALISSMRSSLIYLREQAEYVSFEVFLEESTKPFSSLIETGGGQSLAGFLRRVALIKELFCYLRKQNEMSLPEALRAFGELNGESATDESIQRAYQQYCDRKFINILFRDWSVQFKQTELPQILARVAAVWSIAVSTDVSSTGKFFKPHCVQILCVLKLLGVDADGVAKGVPKHLAQVLTGQGKSLILALIAAVLALTGHYVQIGCYNEYLVKRDGGEFEEFYKLLGVSDVIKYGTFEDMANAVVAPEVDGKRMELRTFVQEMILSDGGGSRPKKPKPQVRANSVLLMDEVDVFFTKEYYGNVYCPASFLYVPGLAEIQVRIWNEVHARDLRDTHKVTAAIQRFIGTPLFTERANFAEFRNKATPFDLLIYDGTKHVRRSYTCKELFDEHLQTMASNAIEVETNTANHRDYKLSPEGVITHRVKEKYENRTFIQYYCVFHYFRLKQGSYTTFVSPSGFNYGYLNVACGSLSYAMLPKAYPLILGVTGTLTALHPHEKAAISQLYDINRTSLMPSFFGCSRLAYDPSTNFTKLSTKSHWLAKIFTHVLVALGESTSRSVLVFFRDEATLEEFRVQFSGQLARLQVLTENSAQQAQITGQAGVPGTVTLATRAMGRGVDFRSSVAVEKAGGVHVVQTFFSLDVKEERQIRGRTARKDNRGSYELVLWEEDLRANGLDGETYAELEVARAELVAREGGSIAKGIEQRGQDHRTTMQYLQGFFE
ncbi:hypothetical protein quinque_014923 [Culex quinquefasciatus]